MFWSLSIQIYFWAQKVFETVFWKKILFSWKKMSSRQENALLHALLCQIFAPPYMRSCAKKKLSNMTPLTMHFCGISALLRKSCCDEIVRRILKKTTRHILQMRSFFYRKKSMRGLKYKIIHAGPTNYCIETWLCQRGKNQIILRDLLFCTFWTLKKRWDKESTFKSQ